ncbi:cytochrome P450 [Aspergillus keveii]|uniref:Cytochrome P450 n=1 Tax=Aspergillus keveii TaxID=714993 RepID=A0ABR4FTS2_9EURO
MSSTILIFVCALILYRQFLHPLAGIPGLFFAELTGQWRNWYFSNGQWHDVILNLHERYGRVVRLAPNELSIVDAMADRLLYGHGTKAEKTHWYGTWDIPDTAAGLFGTRDVKEHSFLRRRVSAAFSMSSILKFEPYIQGCFDLLFEKIRKYSGQVVNMSEWTNAVAYDIVGELAYGEQLGHLRTETDVMGLRQAILDGFYVMANFGHLWGLGRLLNTRVVAKLTSALGVRNAFGDFRQWSMDKVRARRERPSDGKRHDMLHHFLKMKDINGDPASDGEVLIEAMNTTAIGMRACLYYVCTHARVYHRLQKELDDYFAGRPDQGSISYNEARRLTYLNAVISEATRLHPSIIYQLLRKAPENMTVDRYTIPRGTPVGISPRAQNRDPAIWGEGANEFRPERWLEDEERTRYFESVNMTFGGNWPRMCIGRNIALVELFKYMAQFLYNFDVELVDPARPWHVQTVWFAYQHDMVVRVTERTKRPSA